MTTATLTTTKWGFDQAHSEIKFKAKHMMISTITGEFKNYDVTIETDSDKDDFTTAKINYTADVSSIETGNAQRDGHLKTNDFFNPEQYPKINFASTEIVQTEVGKYQLIGDLTIRDVTKPITLDVEFEGKVVDPWGNTKYGFTVDGKINRKEWGLNWNVITEAGGILVGEEIKIHASVQISKVPANA
jgi:polyisoprenoid-binding protein YceI